MEFVVIILVLVTSYVIHVAAIRTPMCYLKDTELLAICAVHLELWGHLDLLICNCSPILPPWQLKLSKENHWFGVQEWPSVCPSMFRLCFAAATLTEKSLLCLICLRWVFAFTFLSSFITLVKSLLFIHLLTSLSWQILASADLDRSFRPQHDSHLNLIIKRSRQD